MSFVLIAVDGRSEVANTFCNQIITKKNRRVGAVVGGECTHLDELVPASGDDDGVLGVGREPDAGDPLGVALVGDGVLAVTEGVPQLDGAVARAGDDLAVVGGEGDGEDVVGVADEAAGGDTGGELPQAQGLIPRGGESVGTVGGDDLCGVSAQLPAEPVPWRCCVGCERCRQLLPPIAAARARGVRTQSETM